MRRTLDIKTVRLISFLVIAASARTTSLAETPAKKPVLEEVASFPTQKVTGIAVSKTGRIFVNFPFWDDKQGVSVAELLADGTLKPYPDEKWNRPEGDVKER